MPAPFTVEQNPGTSGAPITGGGAMAVDGSGNTAVAGDLRVGLTLLLAQLAAAPQQVPGFLRLYSLDGNTLQFLGQNGLPGTVTANGTTAYYNVKAYGATGNGTTPDDAAINSAIAAAAAAGGGVVYLPIGTYLLNAGLVLTVDGITLLGDGPDATILKPAASTNFDVISTPIPGSSGTPGFIRQYVAVDSMKIDCSGMTGTTAGQGNAVHFYGARYSWVRRVWVNAPKNWAFLLDGDATNFGFNVSVEECQSINGNAGLYCTNCEANFIRKNEFSQAGAAVAAAQPAFGTQDTTAMHLRLGSGYCEVTGNVFGKSGAYTTEAIRISNNGPCRIIGNRFDQVRNQAVRSDAGNAMIIGNQFGNPSSNGTTLGIQLGSNNNIVCGNQFDTTNGAAHYTYAIGEAGGPFTGNIISGNHLIAGSTGVINQNATSTNRIFGNSGYNPVGAFASQPAVPATTVAATNNFGVDATVHVTGGTVTVIAIGGTASGATSGTFRVPAGQTITLTYTAAPTWEWFGD